jgi:hypothetical protein
VGFDGSQKLEQEMRMTVSVWVSAALAGLFLLSPGGAAWAQASSSPGVDPRSPAVRETIEAIHRARQAERRRVSPEREMARVLLETRRLLLGVAAAPAGGDEGVGAAELLEANVEELTTLFEELEAGAAGEPGLRRQLDRMAAHLDTLEARVAEIVAAPGLSSRRAGAASLLADLEASLPPQRRLINPKAPEPTVIRLSADHPVVRAVARSDRDGGEE